MTFFTPARKRIIAPFLIALAAFLLLSTVVGLLRTYAMSAGPGHGSAFDTFAYYAPLVAHFIFIALEIWLLLVGIRWWRAKDPRPDGPPPRP